jgi:hypothetical protein
VVICCNSRNTAILYIFEARDWSGQVSDALIELFEDMQTGKAEFPRLKEVRVSFRPMWPWLANEHIEDGEDWWLGLTTVTGLDRMVEEHETDVGVKLCVEPEDVPLQSGRYARTPF